jgi:antitoxin VapB
MPLNLEDDETHALAARVARMTGESLTQAVTTALRERLARIDAPDALAENLLALGRDCAARLEEPWRDVDNGALLYDEKGLPR